MALTYLDHAATTPMRPEAVEAMLPLFSEHFANPSGSHRFARQARQVVDEARDLVAELVGVSPGDVVFTGCGSESDNTVVTGAPDGVAVCPAGEHHAVLHPVEARSGEVVAVDATGHVDLDHLADTLTRLHRAGQVVSVVSVMAVNNEVGTVTDLAAVGRVVRERAPEAIFHTDAVQAPSWLDVRQIAPLVDAMSFSAHKFGGPKGVGMMTLRPGCHVRPLLIGGGQERERRSGTHNVAGIAAFAAALAAADDERADEIVRLGRLRDRLVDGLVDAVGDVLETVPRDAKVAGSAHVCIAGVESESLLFVLDEADLCASAASACASGAMEPSHVLAAMGVDRGWSAGALRMSLGHTTTGGDIERALDVITDGVTRLRRSAVER